MAMLASSMDRLGIDRSVVPLGRIKKEILEKARDILLELRSVAVTVLHAAARKLWNSLLQPQVRVLQIHFQFLEHD